MAQEFSNGESLGTVREKLNGNAREINQKVTAVAGKGLSTNDYTNEEKAKVQALTGAGTGTVDLSGYQAKEAGKGLSTNDYTTTEKNKLAGISAGATANSSDAVLKSRANHTGSQGIDTITNLQANLDTRPPTTPGSPVKPTGTWYGTQAQYDALPTKTATYKYEIYEA